MIAFLAISDQYATFICLNLFHKMASGDHFGWPKITFSHISRHFRSIRNFHFSIGTSLYSRSVATSNIRSVNFWLSYGVHKLFHHIFTKWPPAAILVFRYSPKSIGFFQSRSSMAVFKYEFDTRIGVAVTWNTSLGVRRRLRRLASDQNHNIPEISNFGDIITR